MPSLEPLPDLPSELERHIFEIAAFIHPPCMPVLLLVAQRAKIWIEPLLYETLCIHPANSRGKIRIPVQYIPRLIESRPLSFFHDHVRHLSLFVESSDVDAIIRLLAVCNATVDLQLFCGSPNLLPLLGALPLRRLSADLSHLFPSGRDFSHPLFSNITHLALYNSGSRDWNAWSGLAQLPCLTHLSFHNSPVDPTFCQEALMHCKSLEILAICVENHNADRRSPDYATAAIDPRFVILAICNLPWDWEIGARGGEDRWVTADEFVGKRRSGATQDYRFGLGD
ncbi:hypothetical protein C8R44DRAFT_190392 [Mycena epipterygia]|nr:hypothetical protein C8R44DRAFT_190392 [Mycena epipterygia]